MSQWTDEHLADLLATTFAAHEADADPVVAHRIALTTPPATRRVRPVLVAAAVAIVVIVVGIQALRPDVRPEPAQPLPTGSGHHRAAAFAEVNDLMASVPVPPAAQPLPNPTRRVRAEIGSVDPSLTRSAAWIVPMTYGELADWYAAHAPEEAASERPLWWTEPGTSAYTSPAVIVSLHREAPMRTRLRIDVTIAARAVRAAATFVPDGVTSIDVTRTDITGPVGPPATATVSDPDRVRAIVDAYNRLLGAPVGTSPTPCASPVGDLHVYSATFHWPGHTLAVDPGAPLCGRGRSLVLDGTELTPTLEDSPAFNGALEAAF